MKTLKLLLAILSLSFFIACSVSSENTGATPKNLDVNAILDMNALNNLSGTDATDIVAFDGGSAADYTTEAIVGDILSYKINASSSNTEIRIINFHYRSGDLELWQTGLTMVIDTIARPALAYFTVTTDAVVNNEIKFDIDFKVYTNGSSNNTIYNVDPKIKIRRNR